MHLTVTHIAPCALAEDTVCQEEVHLSEQYIKVRNSFTQEVESRTYQPGDYLFRQVNPKT
jgi:hypothetical protein